MAESNEVTGVLYEGADGAYYFIRQDVLEACRLEGDALERAKQELASSDVSGHALTPSLQLKNPLTITAPLQSGTSLTSGTLSETKSTIMCLSW